MKRIIFVVVAFLPFWGFSQQIGSAGRLLQNENRRNIAIDRKSIATNFNYQWECNYDTGYAEIFIRIPERGRFTINIGEQEITNSNGMYRFFDIPSETQELSIWEGRYLLYRVTIRPKNNTRMILDFFTQRGLFLLEEITLNSVNEIYYGKRWNDVWNRTYRGFNTMQSNDFQSFYNAYLRQTFDNDKLKFFRMQKNVTAFSTHQIASLMKALDFDSNRLSLAKEAYANATDPQNYYQLFDIFTFTTYSRQLSDFLENQRK
ncbi:MAG: DUF4476 domain-containing protein [Bacteroidota bacterium]|nr:DUF4476 domain-containing protein [Bacteroidota bacterium]